jgi:hypothetical protein
MTLPILSHTSIDYLYLLGASCFCVGLALGLLIAVCVKRWDGDA